MNKQRIPPVDPATASGSNKKNFDILKSALGFIPNMALAMAQSQAVLDGYMGLSVALIKGRLGKRLGEELALTLAGTNHCEYCASAHSATAKIAGLDQAGVVAALQGKSEDAREAAALRFATAVVEKRGRIDDADFKAVIDAGFTPGACSYPAAGGRSGSHPRRSTRWSTSSPSLTSLGGHPPSSSASTCPASSWPQAAPCAA